MSVVTRCRSTFSSNTTQFSLMPVASSNFGDSFCMMIMSELLTVAILSVVSATAGPAASAPIMASAELAPASKFVLFIMVPPHLGDVLTRRLLRPILRRSRLPCRLPPHSYQLRARRLQPAGPCFSATSRRLKRRFGAEVSVSSHASTEDAKSAPLTLLKGSERAATTLRTPLGGTFTAYPPPSDPNMG